MRTSILLALLVSVPLCFAQSPYPDPYLGVRPGAFSARSMSLGHSLMTDESGPAAMMGNPATLARQANKWRIDLTSDISRIKEIRKYPVYDSFNANLTYNNYAVNDNLYSRLEGGAALSIPNTGLHSLVISAASYAAYRFDYTYHEEVRNRFTSGGIQDLKLGDNRLDIDGSLRSLTLGAAGASENFAVGFSVSSLFGSWDYERGIFYADSLAAEDAGLDSLTYVDRAEYKPKGWAGELAVGASWVASDRLVIGVRALVPGDFKFKQNVSEDGYSRGIDSASFTSGEIQVTYPKRFGGGVQYRPRGEFRPLLLLEGEVITYSDVNPNYDDTFEIRAGAEQQIVPGAPVRLGFVYGSSPQDKDRATSMFTAGIGFVLQKLHGDFGVEIGKVNYLNPDMFPQRLYGDTDRIDEDHVETALFRGIVSLRYEL